MTCHNLSLSTPGIGHHGEAGGGVFGHGGRLAGRGQGIDVAANDDGTILGSTDAGTCGTQGLSRGGVVEIRKR